jgi:plasmid maintenance system killer protein
VIRSFRDSETEKLFRDQFSRRFQAIERTARRKLSQLDRVTSLWDSQLSAISDQLADN